MRTPRRWLGTALATGTALAVGPGTVAAQPVDASMIVEASGPVKAVASLLLVALVGGVILTRYEAFVDRSVDETMAKPGVAIFYGIVAYVLVVFFTVYASDLLFRAGLADTSFALVALALLVGGLVLLAGLGYLLLGTLLTDLFGPRRPWQGLVAGAVLSGLSWLLLPLLPAFAVWVLLAAFGLGGPTRTWVHRERTVESET